MLQHGQQVTHGRGRRQVRAHFGIADRQADGITLTQHHETERTGEPARVVEFGDA